MKKVNQNELGRTFGTPSPPGASSLKNNHQDIGFVEPKQETETIMASSTAAKEKEKHKVRFLEHELECPRCHDNMELCSDFDNLYYVCKECDFCLYTIEKLSTTNIVK